MSFEGYINCLIKLVKSAILNTAPERLPDDIDLKELLFIAEQHSIENIVYLPLSRLVNNSNETLELFEAYYNYAVLHDATQQYYLELVIDELEKAGIRHCVLKGPVIKKLYPSTDLRKSKDIDIFVDDDNTENVRGIMVKLGFTVKDFNKSAAHDIYIIDENIRIEVHRSLISSKCPWDAECQKIADRLILSPDCKYRCEMDSEDYYLHMIGHMAKHMKYSGIGIKMVLDVWIYMREYSNTLDWDILNKRLTDCGLNKFEKNIRLLCKYWFEDGEASNLIERLALYIGSSGNFGSQIQEVAGDMAQNSIGSSSKNVSRLVCYAKVFFWPYKKMREKYKILKVIPVLLPFCWLHRAFMALFFKEETVKSVIGKYDDVDMEYGKDIIAFKKEIGL